MILSASVHAGILPQPQPRRHPLVKETPQEGDPLAKETPQKERPPEGETPREGGTPCQGDPPQEGDPPLGPHPRGKLRGIKSRPTPKGEIEGDQIQAHTQGGN